MSRPRARRGHPAEAREPPDAAAALEIAVRYLGSRPRTRWEVERRLRRAGAIDEVVAGTVERLTRLGVLDDAAFARWWTDQRDRHAPRGRRMLEAELRQHGIGREVIEAIRNDLDAPERRPEDARLPATDEERAQQALERHLRGRPMPDDPKVLQRLGMFLMRRGFDAETVRATIRRASDTAPSE